MSRRLFLLNGIFILCVVFSHAADFVQITMIWWADRYLPVTIPDYSQMGSLAYYFLVVIRQLCALAVPGFLITTGYFVAFADRGIQNKISWKFVWNRIVIFFIPYLIWSIVIFIYRNVFSHNPISFLDFVKGFLSTGIVGPYFYVPLLCYFYLLSPILTRLARTHPIWLLIAGGILQVASQGFRYLLLVFGSSPTLDFLINITPYWSITRYILFFNVGLVIGYRVDLFKLWLAKVYKRIAIIAIISGIIGIVEPELVFQISGLDWRTGAFPFSVQIYSFATIFLLLAIEIKKPFIVNSFNYLGGRTFVIYLLHFTSIDILTRFIYHFAPLFLAYQVPLTIILLAWGLAAPLIFMKVIEKTPVKRFHRFIFG